MEQTLDNNSENAPARRPVFLTVLCILTFVASGFSFIGLLINLFVVGKKTPDQMEQQLAETMSSAQQMREQGMEWFADFVEKAGRMGVYTNDAFYTIFALNVLTFALGLAGAILMWRGRRIGFHSYVLYNIVGILAIYIAVPVSEVPNFIVITNVIISAGFIFMYSRNLHWLK